MTRPTRKAIRPVDPVPALDDAALHLLRAEMEALLNILPGAVLHLSPPGQPDEEAVEASFDNMPV